MFKDHHCAVQHVLPSYFLFFITKQDSNTIISTVPPQLFWIESLFSVSLCRQQCHSTWCLSLSIPYKNPCPLVCLISCLPVRRTNLSLSFLPSPSKSFFSSLFFCGRLTNNLLSPRCFRLLPFSLFPCTHCGNANCKGKKERGALGNSSIYVFLSLSLSLSLFLGRVRERGKKRTGLSGETRGGQVNPARKT